MKWRALFVAAFLAVPTFVFAQTAERLLLEAQNAFQSLEFEQAAQLYTLALNEGARATRAQRDTAQLYLGISYAYADQRDNAIAAFRTLVRSNPCVSTPQAFGASVAGAFEEARSTVMSVGLCNFQEQRFEASDSISLSITVTRASLVLILLQDAAGGTVAQLGSDLPAGNSTVRWVPPLDAATITERPTPYSLLLRARDQNGTATGQDSVLIFISASAIDTLLHPSPLRESDFLIESRPMSSAYGDLGKGLSIGAGIAATSLLAYSSLGGENAKAIAVGGAVSLAGIIALLRGSSNRAIPENQQHNAALRSLWETRRDSVVEVNRSRLAARQLVIAPAEGGR